MQVFLFPSKWNQNHFVYEFIFLLLVFLSNTHLKDIYNATVFDS